MWGLVDNRKIRYDHCLSYYKYLVLTLPALIQSIGYLGVTAIIFAESGLLIGFFLPGDSLLFTAGFLASQDFFDIRLLMALLAVAAITGDSVGYATGYRFGRRLFNQRCQKMNVRMYLRDRRQAAWIRDPRWRRL